MTNGYTNSYGPELGGPLAPKIRPSSGQLLKKDARVKRNPNRFLTWAVISRRRRLVPWVIISSLILLLFLLFAFYFSAQVLVAHGRKLSIFRHALV